MKKNFTVTPKLTEVNAFRVAHGLEPLVAVKTAKKDRKAQNANRAAHAQACRDLKAKRTGKGK